MSVNRACVKHLVLNAEFKIEGYLVLMFIIFIQFLASNVSKIILPWWFHNTLSIKVLHCAACVHGVLKYLGAACVRKGYV